MQKIISSSIKQRKSLTLYLSYLHRDLSFSIMVCALSEMGGISGSSCSEPIALPQTRDANSSSNL